MEELSAPVIEELSELPLPAHDLCGYARYLNRGGFVGVQTKRGCPLGCVYCIYPQLEGKRYRLRPPEAIVEEVEKVVVGSKLKHFFFVDSVFNDPAEARAGRLRRARQAQAAHPMVGVLQPAGLR